MDDQADHLRKIGQGRFPAVTLPVGVGGETDGRVEGQVLADRPEALGIQRQKVLQAQDGVSEQKADQAEAHERQRVLLPGLFLFGVQAKEPVKQLLYGAKRRVQKRLALRVQHPGEVDADGLRQQEEKDDEEGQLNPAENVHEPYSSKYTEMHCAIPRSGRR